MTADPDGMPECVSAYPHYAAKVIKIIKTANYRMIKEVNSYISTLGKLNFIKKGGKARGWALPPFLIYYG